MSIGQYIHGIRYEIVVTAWASGRVYRIRYKRWWWPRWVKLPGYYGTILTAQKEIDNLKNKS